jgi:hypothetical protein
MTQDTYNLIVTVVVFTILGGLFWLAFKVSRGKDGRIRTYSAAWWMIVLTLPWGWLWALCRSNETATERARNLREISGTNDR